VLRTAKQTTRSKQALACALPQKRTKATLRCAIRCFAYEIW